MLRRARKRPALLVFWLGERREARDESRTGTPRATSVRGPELSSLASRLSPLAPRLSPLASRLSPLASRLPRVARLLQLCRASRQAITQGGICRLHVRY